MKKNIVRPKKIIALFQSFFEERLWKRLIIADSTNTAMPNIEMRVMSKNRSVAAIVRLLSHSL